LNDFNKLLAGLQQNNLTAQTQPTQSTQVAHQVAQPVQSNNGIVASDYSKSKGGLPPLFEVSAFRKIVKEESHNKNKTYAGSAVGRISGYSIGHDCIRTTLFKMLNYNITDYSANWLPLGFRAALGTTVHSYIQDLVDGKLFSECELTLKVPSLHLSMRLDAVINDETIVEIKSCSYADYSKMLRSRIPRTGDFYQVIFYRYLLRNHLAEIKKQKPSHGGKIPGLDKYNLRYIQMLYLCHEIIAGDSNESMSEAVKFAASLRKYAKQETGYSDFWFMLPLTIDTEQIDIEKYETHLINKMNSILEHYEAKKIPDFSNPYTDTSKCFFCAFKQICNPPRK